MDTPNCGWCVGSKSCIEVGGLQTFPQSCPSTKCGKDCLKTKTESGYDQGVCPLPASAACTAYKSCTTCTKDPGCGWFSETQQCQEASRSGTSCHNKINGTIFNWGDCNDECSARGPQKLTDPYKCGPCTGKGLSPDVKCGFCEGYQEVDAGM